MAPRDAWSDEKVEAMIGTLLRAGVTAASALIAVGAVLFLARHGGERPEYRVFRGEPRALRGLIGIARDALRPSGRGVIQMGLLLLVMTPVARVAFSLAAFARQRDRTYVAITGFVLLVLLWGLLGTVP